MFHRRKKELTMPLSNTNQTPMASSSSSSPPFSSYSSSFLRTPTPFRFPLSFKSFLFILSLLVNIYLLVNLWAPSSAPFSPSTSRLSRSSSSSTTTTRRHLLFAIASSSLSWRRREPYVRLWYSLNSTRAFVFLDSPPANNSSSSSSPPVVISADTSRFPYTFKGGLRSAVRLARVVKEVVDRNESDVRWFVFGDDDTVFVVDNLVKTLSKYDHDSWFYVGSNSESYEQNAKYSFDMAFGGGGFAISHSLARFLARVLDSCLRRYGHLYGSDSRIYSCVAELGVGLTHEPGFHQFDVRGNSFGMLAAHPLSPLLSLHHLDAVEPLFPNMDRTHALEHLMAAANVDPARILQQTVCYERSNSLTFSVSWGYAIQVFQGNEFLPDLLSVQRTFMPWKRGSKVDARFMFSTRDYPRDPCKRPSVFFLKSVTADKRGIWSTYTRDIVENCIESSALKQLKQIEVFSRKLELDIEQMKAPRRQCCNLLPSSNESISINIRQCEVNELISMQL